MKISRNQIGAVVLGWLGIMALSGRADVLFSQDFSSSTTVGSYVNATTPSQNQFTLINGGTTSITNGQLKLVNAAGTPGNIRRWVDMVGTPVDAMVFSYDMNLIFSEAVNTRLITGTIGQPAAGQQYMAWGIDATGTANTWKVTGTTNTFSGNQTLRIFINDSTAALSYTDPLGGAQSMITNSFDIWVGTTKVVAGNTGAYVHPEYDLTAFALAIQSLPAVTGTFDNFIVQTIPEPATLGLIGFAGAVILLVRRSQLKK